MEDIKVSYLCPKGVVNQLFQFDIDASGAGSGRLAIDVNDGSIKCLVTSLGNRKYRASFLPLEARQHILEMKLNGDAVAGSPFHVDITEKVFSVCGPGVGRVPVNKSTSFTVCPLDRSTHVLAVTIKSPSGRRLVHKIEKKRDGAYEVEYIPLVVGTYSIKLSSDGPVVSACSYSSEAFDISAITLSHVCGYSQGRTAEFEIDTSKAGDGELEVKILSKDAKEHRILPHTLTLLPRGVYLVTFPIVSPEPAYAVVSFNKEEMSQSPFRLDSAISTQWVTTESCAESLDSSSTCHTTPRSSIASCSSNSEQSEPQKVCDTLDETNERIEQQNYTAIRDDIAEGLEDLEACTDEDELDITIARQKVVDELLELYKDPSITSQSLSVTFVEEGGVDCTGLTKDLMTTFWRNAKTTFFRGEDCLVPDLPLHRVRKEMWKFECLGRILSHTVALTGTIPSMFCRSTLIKIFTDDDVDDDTLLEDFLQFVTSRDRTLLSKAMHKFTTLNAAEQDRLRKFYTTHGFHTTPKRTEVKEQILGMAHEHLVETPALLIAKMRQGIPVRHKAAFWQRLSAKDILHILQAQKATPTRVANVITTGDADLTNDENRTLYFLKEFVENLDFDALTDFLIFVTGSVHQPDKITVTFTALSGLSRRPISHTCFNHLEVPTTYSSIREFKKEFLSVLASPEAFLFSEA